MLFCDESGSMSGTPFNCMKEGLLALTDTIFGESEADNTFDEGHPIFWGSNVIPFKVTNKRDYLDKINNERCDGGGTDILKCLNHLE